ncbi:helix-turn-helix domain-containing protein [Thiothrix litoralis]|uniref:Helix-turn-helix domain-containing protein n=1 Tax=Thiothrix litoralis TaxID=2891210 RepID=A0ABX7WRG9_9GAMM|nr:helix-turn-helix domain-containing protein [Thiothrix litoralis]
MIISHKICLNPNNKQATYLAKAAGIARFAYNSKMPRKWQLFNWEADSSTSLLDVPSIRNSKRRAKAATVSPSPTTNSALPLAASAFPILG